MPPRSVKMKRRILGFQRRVWWPKWTPASKSSRMETTGTGWPLSVGLTAAGGAAVEPAPRAPAPPPGLAAGSGAKPLHLSQRLSAPFFLAPLGHGRAGRVLASD